MVRITVSTVDERKEVLAAETASPKQVLDDNHINYQRATLMLDGIILDRLHLPRTEARMDAWTELSNPRDLAKLFDATDYAAWRSFRDSPDSRYLALAMPRFLGRPVYGAKSEPIEEFAFEEETGGDHDKHLWVNASYAMGVRVTEAFSTWGSEAQFSSICEGSSTKSRGTLPEVRS